MYSISLLSHKTDSPGLKWTNWSQVLRRDEILTLEEVFAWRNKFCEFANTIDFGKDLYALEIKDENEGRVVWNKLLEQQANAS